MRKGIIKLHALPHQKRKGVLNKNRKEESEKMKRLSFIVTLLLLILVNFQVFGWELKGEIRIGDGWRIEIGSHPSIDWRLIPPRTTPSRVTRVEEIEVLGPPEFKRIIRKALSILPSQDKRFVLRHGRQIVYIPYGCGTDRALACARIYGNLVGDYTIIFNGPVDGPLGFIASILVHEAVHLAGGGEGEAYLMQADCLRRLGAPYSMIQQCLEMAASYM
jgi:hypothetical protein